MDVLIVLLIVFLFLGGGVGPWWGYHHYGYGPSGLFWTLAILCLIVWLVRRTRTA